MRDKNVDAPGSVPFFSNAVSILTMCICKKPSGSNTTQQPSAISMLISADSKLQQPSATSMLLNFLFTKSADICRL